jgi:hypothetical protein
MKWKEGKSKNERGFFFADVTICNPDTLKGMFRGVFPMPDLGGLPDSYALGVCGLTG